MTLPPAIYRVVAEAAQMYTCLPGDITGRSHLPHFVGARRKAAQDLRAMGFSYPEIGRWLGGRDHATVIAMCRPRANGKLWDDTRTARLAGLRLMEEPEPWDEWGCMP